ncbi:MAG: hypothetical protein NTX61_04335 [Bacteroidetes bacterium]|nr:hypothetical protein [Bacteroidota bacterium]
MKKFVAFITHAVTMIIFLCILLPFTMQAQDKGTYTDKRDGHSYRWIRFGKQVWMTENLKFTTKEGSWLYDNDTSYTMFGRMYDWNAAVKACPQGWHLPTDGEWDKLITVLGGADVTGEKFQKMDTLKMKQDPRSAMAAKDFSSLILGVRHTDGTFSGLGIWGGCWSATAVDDKTAGNFLFVFGGKSIGKSTSTKISGFPVRCIKTNKGK